MPLDNKTNFTVVIFRCIILNQTIVILSVGWIIELILFVALVVTTTF